MFKLFILFCINICFLGIWHQYFIVEVMKTQLYIVQNNLVKKSRDLKQMLSLDGFEVAVVKSEAKALNECTKVGYSYKIMDAGCRVYIRRSNTSEFAPK